MTRSATGICMVAAAFLGTLSLQGCSPSPSSPSPTELQKNGTNFTQPVTTSTTTTMSTCLGRCGIAMNIGEGGSCALLPCSGSRGATHCTMGMCFCNEGYCRYPVTTLHVQSRTCRQRAGHNTCHMSRFCYNAGLTTSTCSGGLCFCKFGYRYNCYTRKCEWHDGISEVLPGNMTRMDMAELELLQKEGDRETMYNAITAAMWGCAAFLLMTG